MKCSFPTCVVRRKAPWTGQGMGLRQTCVQCDPPVSCFYCLLKCVVEAGMNSPSQTLQRSDGTVKHVYRTVKLLIAKSTVFK